MNRFESWDEIVGDVTGTLGITDGVLCREQCVLVKIFSHISSDFKIEGRDIYAWNQSWGAANQLALDCGRPKIDAAFLNRMRTAHETLRDISPGTTIVMAVLERITRPDLLPPEVADPVRERFKRINWMIGPQAVEQLGVGKRRQEEPAGSASVRAGD